MRSIYVLKWVLGTINTYNFGSKVAFHNGQVHFENVQMSPGSKIHTWYSKTNFFKNRTMPDLPLLKAGFTYVYQLNLVAKPTGSAHFQIDFFNDLDEEVDSLILNDLQGKFEVPAETNHCEVSVLNFNNQTLEFNNLVIMPKEFNDQVRVVVHNGDFKLVGLMPLKAHNEQKVNISLHNTLFNTGTYPVSGTQSQIYIEINGHRRYSEPQLQDLASRIAKQLQLMLADSLRTSLVVDAIEVRRNQNSMAQLTRLSKLLIQRLQGLPSK